MWKKGFEKQVHFCRQFMITSYFASSATLLRHSPVCKQRLQGSQSERGSKVDDLTKVQLSLTNCPVRGPETEKGEMTWWATVPYTI